MLAGNLRRARMTAELTLENMAWTAGVDKGYASRIEAGQRAPTLPVLRKLAKAVGVKPWELLKPEATEDEPA